MVLARMYAAALRIRLRDRELLSPEEIISLTLLLAGVTAGFRGVSLWGVSPVRTAMLLVCMAAGFLGGAGLGAAVGALTGLMLGVTSPAEPWLLGGLVLLITVTAFVTAVLPYLLYTVGLSRMRASAAAEACPKACRCG